MDRTAAKFRLYCPFCGVPTEVSIDDQKIYLEHVAAHCISLYSSISDVDERHQVAPMSRMELLSRLSSLLSSLLTLSNALWNQPKTKSPGKPRLCDGENSIVKANCSRETCAETKNKAKRHKKDDGTLLERESVNGKIYISRNAEERFTEKGTRTIATVSKYSAIASAFSTGTASEDPRPRKRKHQ